MIVLLILMALIFSIIGIHVSYPLLLRRFSGRNFLNSSTDLIKDVAISEVSSDLPTVSIIIPVYNEELVIERRINNIYDSSYPKDKLEIIVVDSGSNDNTRAIIEEKFTNGVILLHEEQRSGKAHAINLALKISRGEIILITDAPTLYNKDTIIHLVDTLKSPSIGGVSALYNIPNADENQVTASEYSFWSYKDKIRILESRAYSTSWLSGEACAFKKKIITKVHEDTLADDSNVALQIISKGYRVVVNEKSIFTEKSPSEVYDYLKIKARRVLGGLRETLRFKFFLFNPEYGHFGRIIFPYRFFAQFVSPIACYVAIILAIPAAIEINMNVGIFGLLLIGISLLFAAFIFMNKLMTYIFFQLITSIALLMLITKRGNVKWDQSRTTRL